MKEAKTKVQITEQICKQIRLIRKNGEYFVGYKIWSDEMTWSNSVYDAWRTRDRELAEKVARKTGGIMVLFNPIVNQKKVMGA